MESFSDSAEQPADHSADRTDELLAMWTCRENTIALVANGSADDGNISTDTALHYNEGPPNKHLPLSKLDKRHADTGTWLLDVFHPIEDIYEFSYKIGLAQDLIYTGCKRTQFCVTLVSVEDPSQYCHGHFRKNRKNEAKYELVTKALKYGTRLIMSKVCFFKDPKLAYCSCPLKVVIDLSLTTLHICKETPSSVVRPIPTATVAGIVFEQIAHATSLSHRCFDVTAVIQEVQDVQLHAGNTKNRFSFVVKIYDGSLDPDTKQVKVMPLRIYFDIAGDKLKTLAEKHLQSKTALSFFCIASTANSFNNTRHTFITKGVCKCRLCGRIADECCVLDGWPIGLICCGVGAQYHCLNRITNGATPNQIVGEALEKILGARLNTMYLSLAWLVAPWIVKYYC